MISILIPSIYLSICLSICLSVHPLALSLSLSLSLDLCFSIVLLFFLPHPVSPLFICFPFILSLYFPFPLFFFLCCQLFTKCTLFLVNMFFFLISLQVLPSLFYDNSYRIDLQSFTSCIQTSSPSHSIKFLSSLSTIHPLSVSPWKPTDVTVMILFTWRSPWKATQTMISDWTREQDKDPQNIEHLRFIHPRRQMVIFRSIITSLMDVNEVIIIRGLLIRYLSDVTWLTSE